MRFTCQRRQSTATRPAPRPEIRHKQGTVSHWTVCRAQPGDRLTKSTDKTHNASAPTDYEKSETFKQPSSNIALYLGGAVVVGLGISGFKGFQAGEEYFAGYLLEQSLSVDNLFVFMLCFNYFKTPEHLQERALSVGIWSAALLRLIMILAGVELVENFKPLLLVFAGILLYSAYGLLFGDDENEEEDLSENMIVRSINKVFTVTKDYRGDKFFVREDGQLKVTPLFVVLAVIEISDVIFAVDSIPAIFGVTLDPVVVYTSNMAAILSLRALYTFVSDVISELRYLDKAVAVILAFIGGKMILDEIPWGFHISTEESLLFVAATLGGGVVASLLFPPKEAASESEDSTSKSNGSHSASNGASSGSTRGASNGVSNGNGSSRSSHESSQQWISSNSVDDFLNREEGSEMKDKV